MNALTDSTFLFDLETRNKEAERIIGSYARMHAKVDVGIGIAGLFVPGGGLMAMIASIAAQAPLIYQPMARDLAKVYCVPSNHVTDNMVLETVMLGAAFDVASEVGTELLTEIGTELLYELGVGGAVGFIPVIGGLAAAAIDATVAATLTWRVGTMISAYHQNANSWIDDRRTTYERAKTLVGGYSPQQMERVKLDTVSSSNPEVLGTQVQSLQQIIEMMQMAGGTLDAIRFALGVKKVPSSLIDLAFRGAAFGGG